MGRIQVNLKDMIMEILFKLPSTKYTYVLQKLPCMWYIAILIYFCSLVTCTKALCDCIKRGLSMQLKL